MVAPDDRFREVVVRHPSLSGHILEVPCAVVAEQLAGEVLVADVQVQVPVTVVVRPCRGLGGEMLAAQPCFPSDISKASPAVVPEQGIGVTPPDFFQPRPSEHEDVRISVIVVVGLDEVESTEHSGQPCIVRAV